MDEQSVEVCIRDKIHFCSKQRVECGAAKNCKIVHSPWAEYCRGVSMLHLYGETEGRSPLPTLFQTLLLQLHTSELIFLCAVQMKAYFGVVKISTMLHMLKVCAKCLESTFKLESFFFGSDG